jgi:hypothetical protein
MMNTENPTNPTRKPSQNILSRFRKLFLVSATVVLIAGGFAQAQKGKDIDLIGPPVQFDQTISVQDDLTGNFLVFSTGTGKYFFTRCSDGFTLGGVGVVKVDGCMIQLEDLQAGHRVVASVNECAQQGKAIVEKFAPDAFKVFFSDQDGGINLMDCAPKK